jgi:type IV pilus assembly protein PilM
LGITSGSGTDAVLILPDQAARLFVLDFEDLPARAAEAMPIVKLRLKKSVPFDIDSAALSYSAQRVGAGWQVVAVVTPQAIVQEYEQMAEELGLRPRWVNLSTLASLGLAEPMEPESAQPREGDGGLGSERDSQGLPAVLVVKYSPPWLTTAILQGRHLRLFRTAGIAAESEDGAAAQGPVLESIYPAVAYFQDTYAGRLERIYLCGLGETSAALADVLQTELPLQVAPLVEASRVAAGLDPDPAERHFAALLGIAREQQRAGN